jgi:hypothetical protein
MGLYKMKNKIEKYFTKRVKEVQIALKDRSPWGFICASAFLDHLSKLVAGRDNKGSGYKDFVKNYLARINPSYESFQYKSGSKDLPEQLYYVFRCGLVHQFSLVPDKQSLKHGGRLCSIVLCHRKESKKRNLSHLSPYSTEVVPDAALLVAEDFGKELKNVVKLLFSSKAKTIDPEIENKMKKWVKEHPPIMGGF